MDITLREDYVLLTKNYKTALLLEFFILYQLYQNFNDGMDIDDHLIEGNHWFSLSFPQISKDSLMNLSIPSIKIHVNELIKNEWLYTRKSTTNAFGSSNEYKINNTKLEEDVANEKNKRKTSPLSL